MAAGCRNTIFVSKTMNTSDQTVPNGFLEPKTPKRKNIFEAFYNYIASYITPVFLRTDITPNQVTILSGLFGIIGAAMLASTNHITLLSAAFCVQVFAVLDLVDGNIARAKNMQSKFGQWLDIFFDKLNDLLLVTGLTIGTYRATSHLYVVFLGMTLMGLVFFIQFIMILNDTKLNTGTITKSNNNARNDINNNHRGFIWSLKRSIRSTIAHNLLAHSQFLILVSVFACFNILYFGLWLLVIHAFITLIVIVTHTFYRLWQYEKTL